MKQLNNHTLGISFLSQAQLPNGSFLSYSSPDPLNFNDVEAYPTTFASSLILDCLASCPASLQADQIKQKILTFLLTQKNSEGSFNYWDRTHPISQRLPYPDDLDDSFCALSAIHRTAPKLTTGETLAQSVSLLTHTEAQEGGPYKTWLVPDSGPIAWHDVDLAVNSNIAYFLSLQEVTLPNLIKLAEDAIQASSYASRYYPNEYPLLYFIARWYSGALRHKLANDIISRQAPNASWGSPLNTALAITSLVRMNIAVPRLSEAVAFLRQSQNHDGSWDAEPFCYDPMIQGVSHYAGSSALTTAFCLEALALAQAKGPLLAQRDPLTHYAKPCRRIEKSAQTRAQSIPAPLHDALATWITQICAKDKDGTIRLLPRIFYDSLAPSDHTIEDSFFVGLGQASLFGWIAYTLYDDFLDDEGNLTALPVANVALREMITLFDGTLPHNPGFHQNVTRILDTLEAANAWEVTRCRTSPRVSLKEVGNNLPDYGDLSPLANRSLGHALGAMAVLHQFGYSKNSREIKHTEAFFRHYIIARQLNDDAHDWHDDLSRGHLTAVTTQLLRHALTTLPPKKHTQSLQKLMPLLEDLYWRREILLICDTIDHHLAAARSAIKRNPTIKDPSGLLQLLQPIEQSIHKARETHHLTNQFLTTYTSV